MTRSILTVLLALGAPALAQQSPPASPATTASPTTASPTTASPTTASPTVEGVSAGRPESLPEEHHATSATRVGVDPRAVGRTTRRPLHEQSSASPAPAALPETDSDRGVNSSSQAGPGPVAPRSPGQVGAEGQP